MVVGMRAEPVMPEQARLRMHSGYLPHLDRRSPMHSEMHVDIQGDIDEVWALASAVDRWPVILPHYRYVTVVQERADPPRQIVEMAAWRGIFPVRWLSVV